MRLKLPLESYLQNPGSSSQFIFHHAHKKSNSFIFRFPGAAYLFFISGAWAYRGYVVLYRLAIAFHYFGSPQKQEEMASG